MKKNKIIEVKVLDVSEDKIKVKLPYAKIPIQMNRPFFIRRLKDGYYKLHRPDLINKIFR
jgi:hypothetical protein